MVVRKLWMRAWILLGGELDAEGREDDVVGLVLVGCDFEVRGSDVFEELGPLFGALVEALGTKVESDDASGLLVEVLVFDHAFQLVFGGVFRSGLYGDIEVFDWGAELVAEAEDELGVSFVLALLVPLEGAGAELCGAGEGLLALAFEGDGGSSVVGFGIRRSDGAFDERDDLVAVLGAGDDADLVAEVGGFVGDGVGNGLAFGGDVAEVELVDVAGVEDLVLVALLDEGLQLVDAEGEGVVGGGDAQEVVVQVSGGGSHRVVGGVLLDVADGDVSQGGQGLRADDAELLDFVVVVHVVAGFGEVAVQVDGFGGAELELVEHFDPAAGPFEEAGPARHLAAADMGEAAAEVCPGEVDEVLDGAGFGAEELYPVSRYESSRAVDDDVEAIGEGVGMGVEGAFHGEADIVERYAVAEGDPAGEVDVEGLGSELFAEVGGEGAVGRVFK